MRSRFVSLFTGIQGELGKLNSPTFSLSHKNKRAFVRVEVERRLIRQLFCRRLRKRVFLEVDGIESAVVWVTAKPTAKVQSTIATIDPRIGGKVTLEDGTMFENPAKDDLQTLQRLQMLLLEEDASQQCGLDAKAIRAGLEHKKKSLLKSGQLAVESVPRVT